jgi:hypothetical protein
MAVARTMRSVPPMIAPIMAPRGGFFASLLLVEREVCCAAAVLDVGIVGGGDIDAGGGSTFDLHQILDF